jgi:hypothetical protein
MSYESFLKLNEELREGIQKAYREHNEQKNMKKKKKGREKMSKVAKNFFDGVMGERNYKLPLAKLHNFCIDESEPGAPEESPTDMMNMLSNRDGYVRMERSSNGTPLAPRGLMHGGQHFNDVPRDVRRRWTSEANDTGSSLLLPRQTMLRKVIDSHKVRPHVNCRQSQKK